MKTKTLLTALAVAAAGFVLAQAPSAQASPITDFSNFVESGNTLGGSNNRQQSFTPSGADITVAHVSGGGAGQEFYLTDEFGALATGYRISVDLTPPSYANFEQVGLAMASSKASPGGDNQLIWAWRANGQLQLTIRDAGNTGNSLVSPASAPDTLFIERTALGWSFGSITGAVETVHFADLVESTTNANADIVSDGSVFGLFSDMRSTSTPKTLSNLTIVPEPGSLALLAIGGLCVLRRRRGE